MKDLPFAIVDVFAEEKYAGNQLAVFLNAAAIPDDEMQSLAREMNYSETTFILSDEPRDGGFDVRIFTPKEEVPFAGHPTLGTACVLRDLVLGGKADGLTLNLKVGKIPVRFDPDGTAWMKQVQPVFGTRHAPARLAEVLQLDESAIDSRFPIEEVSTGLPFFIVPLKDMAVLKKARVNKDKYFALIEDTTAKGILVFCPETHKAQNDLCVRVFVDYYGVPEDPATGSANGCLAGYLVKHTYFDTDKIDIRCEQGYEIGRPSLLLLKAEKDATGISILVGGRSILMAKGAFGE